MFTTIDVVEFGFGDTVVDVDAWADEFLFGVEFVETGDTGGGLFGDAAEVGGEFAEEVFVFLEAVADCLEQIVLIL